MSYIDDSVVRRFLDRVPLVPVEALGDDEPLAPAADRWEEIAHALDVPCPPELLALGDAQARRVIFAGPWELLDPAGARAVHDTIAGLARTMPCLAPHAKMLPVFTADGDVLLLARDGVARRCSLASGALPYDYSGVAPSFAALLDGFSEGRPLPGLSTEDAPSGGGWVWVDELEYQILIGHHHALRAGVATCLTTLTGDLAPHYFRWPDGPGSPPLDGHRPRARAPFIVELAGDPALVPRAAPLGVVVHGAQRIDLAQEGERFIRLARARGWTGRDGKPLVIDGWEALGLAPPGREER